MRCVRGAARTCRPEQSRAAERLEPCTCRMKSCLSQAASRRIVHPMPPVHRRQPIRERRPSPGGQGTGPCRYGAVTVVMLGKGHAGGGTRLHRVWRGMSSFAYARRPRRRSTRGQASRRAAGAPRRRRPDAVDDGGPRRTRHSDRPASFRWLASNRLVALALVSSLANGSAFWHEPTPTTRRLEPRRTSAPERSRSSDIYLVRASPSRLVVRIGLLAHEIAHVLQPGSSAGPVASASRATLRRSPSRV
jgi:hypothetical protein